MTTIGAYLCRHLSLVWLRMLRLLMGAGLLSYAPWDARSHRRFVRLVRVSAWLNEQCRRYGVCPVCRHLVTAARCGGACHVAGCPCRTHGEVGL